MTDVHYAELHAHSCLSLLDGAAAPEDLAAHAHAIGLHALALTDHDELGGAVRFSEAARTIGFSGIIGAELTVAVARPQGEPLITHLPLLAETREGYGNLSTLITIARRDAPRGHPSVTLAQILYEEERKQSRALPLACGGEVTECVRAWSSTSLSRLARALSSAPSRGVAATSPRSAPEKTFHSRS